MASTYVNNLRLEEIGTGEQSGTWGDTTNTNLELIAEAFSFGTEAITTNADTHTTTIADGATDPGRSMFLKYTGTLDSACTITIGPNTVSKLWFIENGTSGSQNIIISQGSGANITIPPGDTKAIYSDGAGSGAAMVDAFASLSVVDLKVQDDLTVTDDATIGGTLGVTGIATFTDDIIIGDGKTIGSASDVDAMTIASNGQVTFTQTLIGTALDISGDIDVDGTTNLDIVDIDGAVDMASTLQLDGAVTLGVAGASNGFINSPSGIFVNIDSDNNQTDRFFDVRKDSTDGSGTLLFQVLESGAVSIPGTLGVTGVVTANAGVVIDEMTLDGDTLTATDTFTIDAVDDIALNSDNSGRILFGDASVIYGIASNSSSNFVLEVGTNDKDMLFKGQDNGQTITALTLDMSQAGEADFNSAVKVGGGIVAHQTNKGVLEYNNNVFMLRAYGASAGTGSIQFKTGGGGGSTDSLAMTIESGGTVLVATGSDLVTNTASGTTNTRIGTNAGDSIVASNAGLNNVLIGVNAGTALDSGDSNIAIGYHALKTEDDHANNIAIGALALENQDAGADGYNVAIGYNAGNDITDGIRNVIIGGIAGDQATTIDDSVIIGYNAGGNATMTGHDNVLIGKDSGQELAAGHLNVMVGKDAGQASETAFQNVFIGEDAGFTNVGGDTNVFVGSDSGYLSTGDGNTYIGKNSGESMLGGSENTILGSYNGNQHGLDIRTTSNNIALSDGDGNPRAYYDGGATSPNWVFQTPTASQYAARIINTNSSTPNGLLVNHSANASDNNGTNFIVCADSSANRMIVTNQGDLQNHDNSYGAISDVKLKDQIADASSQWQDIKDLTIRKYKMKTDIADKGDSDDLWRLGVVAQEVETAGMSGLVYETPDIDDDMKDVGTSTKAVKYSILYMKAVKALQEAMTRIETLETKVAALEG